MKRALILGIVSIFLVFSGVTFAKNLIPTLSRAKPARWNPPRVTKIELQNGFQLYFMRDKSLPLFQAKLIVRAGSAYESHKKAGLAALTANLLSEGGSKKRSPEEIDAWLDQNALELSSSAGKELTQIEVASLSNQWEKALSLLQEVVLSPGWNEKRFLLAKTQFQEGIRRSKDRSSTVLSKAFRKKIYGKKHPWGRSATLKSLKKIKRKDCIQFHEDYFQPNRMLLTIAGDFSEKKVKAWARRTFGSLKSKAVESPDWKILPFKNSSSKKKIKRNISQFYISAGHLGIERNSEDRYAYALLQQILGGDVFISRIGKDIRTTRGLAYSAGSQWSDSPVRGLFYISAQTKKESKDEVLERIRFHLNEVLKPGNITHKELKQAKEAVLNKFIFNFDSSFKIVSMEARIDLLGYPKNHLRTYPKKIKRVTLKEVEEVDLKYIQPDKLAIVMVGP